jgi:hypothetical protein
MKTLFIVILSFVLNSCAKDIKVPTSIKTPTIQNSFQAIWNEVNSDKLTTLPQDKVSFWKLKNIQKDAKRTIENQADILAPFDKLAHPNGICLKGIWQIDRKNPYSGYFKQNSKALIIARASSALSGTKQGETRAFGFAGKLFPTTIQTKINQEETANFFLIDDLGGTKALHYTDTIMTNEPKVSITSEVLKNLPYAIKVAHAFSQADKNSGIRQLYEISQLGETNNTNIITPKWMKIQAQKIQTQHAKDFRDELTITDGKKIIFDISVTSNEKNGKKEWQKIGTITFDNSVVSGTCEHRLHFHHPIWRDVLWYF